MRCCLCKKEIEVKRGYSGGNNASPVKDGRCCDICNETKVIPARLKLHFAKKEMRDAE